MRGAAFNSKPQLGEGRLNQIGLEPTRHADSQNRYRLRWREAVRDPSTSFALLTSLRMTVSADRAGKSAITFYDRLRTKQQGSLAIERLRSEEVGE